MSMSDTFKTLASPMTAVSEAFLGDAPEQAWQGITGKSAADAARSAAGTAVDAQQRSLDYLIERDAMPMAFRDAAMQGLGAEYGLTLDESGNIISDGTSIQGRAMSSPFYTGALQAGESAIGRGSSATGRLRGGATPAMLESNAQDAFMRAYEQQLGGLSQFMSTPTNEQAISQGISGIGNTLSQGQLAAAQAQQQGIGNLMGLAQTAGTLAFSDPRLKDNVKVIGKYKGLDWCEWSWNAAAKSLFLNGKGVGVMADQVLEKYPRLVKEISGYLAVNYEGLENA